MVCRVGSSSVCMEGSSSVGKVEKMHHNSVKKIYRQPVQSWEVLYTAMDMQTSENVVYYIHILENTASIHTSLCITTSLPTSLILIFKGSM